MEEIILSATMSIVALVNSILELACKLKASDIHIDPEEQGLRLRLRLDGMLKSGQLFPKGVQQEIIARIKILAGLRTDEHQAAQDGRFCLDFGQASVDIRVSIVPTYYGENAVLRLLRDQNQDFSLENLGFTSANRDAISNIIRRSYGLVLVTGPTGSGKTTTLYTLIKMLKGAETSIVTIEDPIEYSIGGTVQIGVNQKSGLTFANGLRSILRQDPNIIMVGEIRDRETAGLAVNAALTGHLVFSTIHTNDAATTLPRLIDLGVESYLIASTVSMVISQRLVRKVCLECKGKGCKGCGRSGYRGRISINEVMVVDQALREAIHGKATANDIKAKAKTQGMASMMEDGLSKVSAGVTTIEEVLRTFHE